MLNGRVNVKNGFRNRNITTTKSLIQVARARKRQISQGHMEGEDGS